MQRIVGSSSAVTGPISFGRAAGLPPRKPRCPRKATAGEPQLWGNPSVRSCSALGGAPGAADTSPAKWKTGKEKGGDVRVHRLSGIGGLSGSCVGRGRSGGQGRSRGGAHSSRNRRQKQPGWLSCLCPARLLFFPKTQDENNSLLKSTNLLVPSWGSLPHRAEAGRAAGPSRSPGTGRGCPASSLRPGRILGTETRPSRKTRSALNMERGAGTAGAEPGAWELACAGAFLQLKPNAAQTDSRASAPSTFCGGDPCRERRLPALSVLSGELAWGGTAAGDGSHTSRTLC